jgi:quercetin dioxygenase-like cupin family protein
MVLTFSQEHLCVVGNKHCFAKKTTRTMQSQNQIPTVATAGQGKKFNVLGHAITAILTRENTDGNYYVFECVTPPGLGIPPHVHDREDEIITIVDGEYSVMIGDKRFHAVQGDVCFFPRHVPHSFQNIGTKAGTTQWTVIPGGNFETFFEELGALPAGEPNLELVAKIFAAYGMQLLVPENA